MEYQVHVGAKGRELWWALRKPHVRIKSQAKYGIMKNPTVDISQSRREEERSGLFSS